MGPEFILPHDIVASLEAPGVESIEIGKDGNLAHVGTKFNNGAEFRLDVSKKNGKLWLDSLFVRGVNTSESSVNVRSTLREIFYGAIAACNTAFDNSQPEVSQKIFVAGNLR